MTLVEVTSEEFMGVIYGKNLNVHPRPEKDTTYWEFPNRTLFGITKPGYLRNGPKQYFLEKP
jgi:hypothetical protein